MKKKMTKMKRYLMICMACFLSLLQTTAQEVIDFDEFSSVADSAALNDVRADSLSLSWPASLCANLDHLLNSNLFKTSQVALMVYDLDADSTLYAHNERQLMRPASTMKLITAITALDRLGGGYQFKTELCYTGKVENRTLNGNIYCVGGFDPRFNLDDLRAFVEAIRKMGVDTIRGNIFADKSMKDDKMYGEGWSWDDDNPTLSPLLLSRKDNFVERFAAKLSEAGIVVEANLDTATKPGNAFCICHRFHTMDQILLKMLKDSDNLYAEAMFYQIAASSGSRKASARQARAIIKRLVQKLGFNPDDYSFADGSGLSLYNYVTAELEVAFLRYAVKTGNILLHLKPSMPIAATDGTLADRMRGTFTNGNVYAKTGTLTGVSTLSGYCTAANGHRLAFAIMNQGLKHTRNGRAFQDKVCAELCRP